MEKLTVELADRAYPIYFSESFSNIDVLHPYISSQQVLVVSNDVVAPLYLDKLCGALNSQDQYQIASLILPDGEKHKNSTSLNQILECLLENKYSRDATIIALGGGVIGDVVGFAASIYQRGINFIQIPTSLLAQVDSSVGGKTAINHELGKNMIGSFYQPKAVFIASDTLQTLPDREYASGLAEVVKYGLIRDVPFYQWCLNNVEAFLTRDPQVIKQAVMQSCKHKAEIVIKDEKEQGERAYLNFGHTFGHAIEKCQRYKGYLHGEAVAIGMVLAMELSASLGDLTEQEVEQLRVFLINLKLPVQIPSELKVADLHDAMLLDKKNSRGKMRFVLLKALGDAYVHDAVDLALLTKKLMDNGASGQ